MFDATAELFIKLKHNNTWRVFQLIFHFCEGEIIRDLLIPNKENRIVIVQVNLLNFK